jgi:hypothetical protein
VEEGCSDDRVPGQASGRVGVGVHLRDRSGAHHPIPHRSELPVTWAWGGSPAHFRCNRQAYARVLSGDGEPLAEVDMSEGERLWVQWPCRIELVSIGGGA